LGDKSAIEWTDATWNPVVGCGHVSEGCRNCYAEKMSKRLQGMVHADQYDDVVDDEGRFAGGEINTAPSQLEKPLRWDKPRRIFTCSMSDLFHPDVPFEYIDRVFAVMALAETHTFQVLTKRPERMKEYLQRNGKARYHYANFSTIKFHDSVETMEDVYEFESEHPDIHRNYFEKAPDWPLPNVWLGTSVENQNTADERIPQLIQCAAEVRFLSCEPLLGPVNIGIGDTDSPCIPELDWVIAGGESGPNARPMHPEWVRSLLDQCAAANVPFFFKQWGMWLPDSQGAREKASKSNKIHATKTGKNERWRHLGKDKSGRKLDGRTWDQFPELKKANV
jgi:protein gp37